MISEKLSYFQLIFKILNSVQRVGIYIHIYLHVNMFNRTTRLYVYINIIVINNFICSEKISKLFYHVNCLLTWSYVACVLGGRSERG